jgi:hypothetical protein
MEVSPWLVLTWVFVGCLSTVLIALTVSVAVNAIRGIRGERTTRILRGGSR